MLGILLTLMLPANFLLLNATGPVFFDGEPIAFVYLNGTQAAVKLPLTPGSHEVMHDGMRSNLSFFELECSTEGRLLCNVTASTDITLPYQIICGKTAGGELSMKRGQVEKIEVGGCETASLKIGDYSREFNITGVFENYIVVEGEQQITVLQGDRVILQKFGKGYVGFPELLPGEYYVKAGELEGKLVVKPVESAMYGYVLSAVIVMATIALLWMG